MSDEVKRSVDVQRRVPACLRGVVPIRRGTVSAALYDCVLETLTGELDCPLAAMMLEAGSDEAPNVRVTGAGQRPPAGRSPASCVDRFLESLDGPHDIVFLDAIDDCFERMKAARHPCPLRRALAAGPPDT